MTIRAEVGANQPGMQAAEECTGRVVLPDWGGVADADRKEAWDLARGNALKFARAYAQAGYHKQIVNRLLTSRRSAHPWPAARGSRT